MNKAERQEYVDRRAEELASTGQYRGWLGIEVALRAEGFHEARQWLDCKSKRDSLDHLCAKSLKNKD